MAKTDSARDFTTGKILPKMLRFMLPILLALVLQAMYGAVDLLVVGKFGTNEDISGVSTGGVIINLFTMVVTSLASGVMVVIGHYIGEKRHDRIGKVVGGAFFTFAIIGVLCTLIAVILAGPLARLMQAPTDAEDETILYVRLCGSGLVFIVAYNLISSIFRGMGDSKHPLLFVGVACAVNIVGDLVFVGALNMGVAGAALATVMAQAVSVVLSLWLIIRKKLVDMSVRDIRPNREIPVFLKVGAPVALQSLLTDVSFMMICAFVNRISLEASSGYGIAQKVTTFVMLIPSAIMQSMASFVSQNVGAGKEKRAKESLFTGMLVGGAIGIFISVFAFFYGNIITDFFTKDSTVSMRAFDYLRGFAPEAVVTAVLFSFMGYFSGHGKTLFVMIQSLIQTFLFRVPFSYFMSAGENPSLLKIGLAPPIATVFGILICAGYYLFYQRKLQKAQKNL